MLLDVPISRTGLQARPHGTEVQVRARIQGAQSSCGVPVLGLAKLKAVRPERLGIVVFVGFFQDQERKSTGCTGF
jgi:hypothetical protein